MNTHRREDVTLRQIAYVAVVLLGLWFLYSLWDRTSRLERQVEFLELIRAGTPAERLDASGLKPSKTFAIEYEGQPSVLRYYKSSGASYVRTRDLIIVVNQECTIVATLHFSSEFRHDQFRMKLRLDL